MVDVTEQDLDITLAKDMHKIYYINSLERTVLFFASLHIDIEVQITRCALCLTLRLCPLGSLLSRLAVPLLICDCFLHCSAFIEY